MRASPLLCALLVVSPAWCQEDPLQAPPDLIQFMRMTAATPLGTRAKLQAMLSGIFRSQDLGGLGIVYDNSRTRTVREAWVDRKANCLSLTALFVASCKAVGIEANYAEPTNTNRWRKIGTVIRYERHLVGLIPIPPLQDVVADFLPQLRRRIGAYIVSVSTEDRVRSFFHSNRAVELLDEGKLDESQVESQTALKADPSSSVGWNIHGVILRASGNLVEAEKAFRRALQLDPRDSSALGNMEALFRDQGNLAEAQRYRQMSQDLRKKDPYFNAFLAEEALAEGDFAEAKVKADLALKIHPQEPEFHLLRARIFLMEGNTDSATKAIEQARRWASPAEKDRYSNKLDAIKRWDQDREKAEEKDPDGRTYPEASPDRPPDPAV